MSAVAMSVSWSDDPDQETTVCVRVLEVLIVLVVVQHCPGGSKDKDGLQLQDTANSNNDL